ncbi:MAG: putative tRNA threonylcarbamoyladenosine biosynthesis protein Gcp [Candidatus Curtissbacteria bacterium GW2011_GWA1_40_9]|uniref:tRNA N6-adenosine threonylcarbamoyltransferase n=1 Tax=Candidatus Curtissbacteria bacterium GW2011_GWA1_40_9 TaxID=1618408 RepID=A0A0G0TMF9_9BACT|nr:MAG: putative tRNA threonylcarbamoyladenosine biosynthesis protein Gcp [Candidatus Curtissbacteria bacterium GW2011_GWA1_40_9]
MNILGIESTCDETGVAIVRDGHEILVNILSSSVEMQKKYSGVLPEVAAREQVKVIIPLISEAVKKVSVDKIDAIGVSYGPGLIGPLLVGVESAKALAYAWNKPLIAVNHLVGHFYSNWLDGDRDILFPAVALIVSGGHTDLLFFKNTNSHKLLGSTLDDAAGEAFDKVAKVLGLGYPGGPAVESCAEKYTRNGDVNPFPKPMLKSGDYNFSFSGLKTSVVNYLEKNKNFSKDHVCYFFQEAVVDVLVSKTLKAAGEYGASRIVVGGGVSANSRLRQIFDERDNGLSVMFPRKNFSVDNGAMIAAAAFYNRNIVDPLSLSADSGLHF